VLHAVELIGTSEARSAAAPQAVWDRLVDGLRWSQWSAASDWMVVDDALEAGQYVTIKRKRGRQTAYRIEEAAPPQRLALLLTIGSAARLRIAWTLEPDGPGTLIRQTVESAGPLRRWLTDPLARKAAANLGDDPARLAELAATP
jgi:uncharacterized protein YndB with AHSA1/START domain